jgi:hypothetical protein
MRYLIVFSFILFAQCKTAQQQPSNNNDTLLSGTSWKLPPSLARACSTRWRELVARAVLLVIDNVKINL